MPLNYGALKVMKIRFNGHFRCIYLGIDLVWASGLTKECPKDKGILPGCPEVSHVEREDLQNRIRF